MNAPWTNNVASLLNLERQGCPAALTFRAMPALLVLFLLFTSISMIACSGSESDAVPAASPALVQTETAVPTEKARSSSAETPTAAPTPTATAMPDEPPPASPTPNATETPLPPANETRSLSPLAIVTAPVPEEPAPSGWRTYYNGEFSFSVDHAQYELVNPQTDRPYLQERNSRNRGIFVSVHEVTGADPLPDFAQWYKGTVLKQHGMEQVASEITLIEKDEDGRRYFSMNFNPPGEEGTRCASTRSVRITLSHAYPAKPYAFVVSAGRCIGGNPYQNPPEKEFDELRIALKRFREWNYYRNEQLGWSFSAASEWTSRGWVDSLFLTDGASLGRFNSGLRFTEDEGQGMFLVEFHRFSEDQLSDFADKYRANLLSKATEQQGPVFEMSSVTTTLFRGKESARYTVREQTSEEYCVQDAVIQHILIEPPGYGEVVITAIGRVCETAPTGVSAARDAMLESLRP